MLQLQQLTKWYPTPRGRHYVFRDLDFTFPTGANIGLIGGNGAGKSTLMRLISGTDAPNSGRVVSDKRISWPIGMGGGFQGSLTARENVQFVCRIQGATGKAMRRIVDFVEDFAEIGVHFNLPVSTYSAGMRSRVTFGLSMAFEFDYYLIDEVMAVGDAQFRAKSKAVLKDRLSRANLIMVSHNMAEIARLCTHVVLVDRGNTRLYDNVKAGIVAYRKSGKEPAAPQEVPQPAATPLSSLPSP